jgi:hypothetical protein
MPYCNGIALHPPDSRAHPVSTSRSVLKRGTIPPVGMQPAATETSSNHAQRHVAPIDPGIDLDTATTADQNPAETRAPCGERTGPRVHRLQSPRLKVLASTGCSYRDSPTTSCGATSAPRVSLCSALIDRTSARSRSGPGSSSPRVETRVVQTGPLVTQGRGRSVRAGSTPPLTRLRAGFEQPRETNRRSRLRFTTGQAHRCLAPGAT